MKLEENLIKLSADYKQDSKETFDLFYGTIRHLDTQKSLSKIPLEDKRKIVYSMVECMYDLKRQYDI